MTQHVRIARLKCEHYLLPLGIGEDKPRLSWRFEGDAEDWVQTAYELSITRTALPALRPNRRRPTASTRWPSEPLASGERAEVRVRSFGSSGKGSSQPTDWSTLTIEAGLLQPSDWVAKPVTCELQPTDVPHRPFRIRASFKAPNKFGSIRLYISALGMYESYVNGTRIGDEMLAPGWTAYRHHLVYRTYDLTERIVPGETNVLGAWVGEGWYAGRVAFLHRPNNYGTRPALIAQLVMDGKVVLSTDDSWEWSYGALVLSELLDGEIYDSTLDDDAWSTPAGLSQQWVRAEVLPKREAALLSSQSPPVRVVEKLKAVQVITTPCGKTILDFGQNFAGVIEIVGEPPSQGELVIRHAEVLEHAELGTRPLRNAAATDRIKLGGKVSGYVPKFTSHGFRYVEVTGWPGIKPSDLLGLVTHSAMERTGHYACSHKLINQLHRNVVWSTMSNTISIPTDCPQRDERLGWTGDIQVFSPTFNFLFDSSGFLNSWLKDLYVEQMDHGGNVPVTIPDVLNESLNLRLAIWGDVAAITPYDFYTAFGDLKVLRDQYDSAVLWLEKGVVRDPKTGLWDPALVQLSDWLAPKAPPDKPGDAPTDSLLVANAYLIYTTRVTAEICRALGRMEEATTFSDGASKLTKAFYHEYVTPNGRVLSDTQTALALLVQFNIYPEPEDAPLSSAAYARLFSERLGQLVAKDNWTVATGFAGTPIILLALEKAGQLHHAYRMLQSRDTPSWLSPILLGATTIWERWDSMLSDGSINPGQMTSFNHYALGSVAHFLHSVIGGLSPAEPGWKRVIVKPRPGGTITWAKTSFVSPYGLISCEWVIVDDKLEVDVAVPPNTTATVVLPDLEEDVGSGKWHFSVAWTSDARFPPKGKKDAYNAPPSENWEP
ncbi:hypothetical protein JCM24511_07346 [Saitozyma sp. JCM 24511]|nr:hypothetical protein JCM24511_07346 [Saitozyma sp. JCM 24511]